MWLHIKKSGNELEARLEDGGVGEPTNGDHRVGQDGDVVVVAAAQTLLDDRQNSSNHHSSRPTDALRANISTVKIER